MKTTTRIRKLARSKIRIQITKRRRKCLFIVLGPDRREQACRTKAEAINLLLVRLRCWDVTPWRILAAPQCVETPIVSRPHRD
jgi:hypothetical protein